MATGQNGQISSTVFLPVFRLSCSSREHRQETTIRQERLRRKCTKVYCPEVSYTVTNQLKFCPSAPGHFNDGAFHLSMGEEMMQLQILRRTPSRPDLPSCQRRHPQMLPARLRYQLLLTLHLPQTLHLLQTRHPRRVLFPEDPRSPVRQKQELRLRASPHQLLLQKLFLQGRVSLLPDLRSWNAEGRTDKPLQSAEQRQWQFRR